MAVSATDEEVEAAVARVKAAVQPDDRRRVRRRAGAVRDDPRGAEAADAPDDHAAEGHRPRRHVAAGPVRRRPAPRVRAQEGAVLRDPGVGARGRDRAQVLARGRRGAPAGRRADRGDPRRRSRPGRAFADLAKEISEGTTRTKGGDLGDRVQGRARRGPRRRGIRRRRPQEYPAPALLPDSIHLFHVTDRKAAGFKPFSEVKDDLRKRISDDLYEKRFAEYMDKLRRDAFVKIYVPELAKLDEKKPASLEFRPPAVRLRLGASSRLLLRCRRALARLVRPAALLLRRGDRAS